MINAQAAISFSGMDFAKLNHHPNVSGNLYLSIKEQMNDFTAGSFVGFDLENNSLSWMDFIHRVSITTYSNGILHESFTGSELVFGVSATAGGDRQTIGIVTSMVSDEVRLTINQQENVNLGMTKVYGAVFQVVCPGQRMECNSLFAVTNPTQPVVIDASHTGISGPVCVACDVINAENVIDSDPANFATITLPAGVLSSGNIAVQNIATDFTAGTFAGYHIENTALIGANLFNGLTISTYLNGSLQETQTGSEALVSVASDILVNSGEQIAGFITSLPFDEVKLTLSNAGFFNIGTTKIYGLLLDSMCTAPIVCDTTSWLVSPDYPVIIDQSLTGITGVVCALCAVNNGMNIISADPTDYATITMTAGVAASGSIGIVDGLNTYPEGTVTGFAIEDVNNLIEANLFNSLTISTYNNGVFQESFTGSELLDAQVHIEWIPSGESIYNVGVKATMPFDAVRLSVGSIAGINNTINVYGVFVNTDLSVGQGLECDACPNVTIKVLLEGPYDSTTQIMSTQLNEYHVLPGQDPLLSANPGAQLLGIAAPAGQPYDTIPWNWSGREGDAYGDGPGDIPYDEEVVDWMLVSVRANDSLPESEVWKCAGLLYSDGTVVFPEDCACASGLLPTTPYYVVVEHRNHLPVMSEKILMTDNELVFDFTESQSWVYDLGGFELGKGQKPAGSKYVMFAANSEQVSARVDINSSDDAQWLIDNGTIFQYKSGDHNLDGDVNATDEFIWLGNNSTFTLIPFN